MKVKFTATWFAPGEAWEGWPQSKQDRVRVMSGKRFRKGIWDVPEELRPVLPSTATVLDENVPLPQHPAVVEPSLLHEADTERAAAEATDKMLEEAEAERKRVIAERMAKARAARGKKD